jgi:hypothetical protein
VLDPQFAHVRVAAVGDARRVWVFQVDAEPRQQIHGMRHALLLFNAQAMPPLLEFISEENRTFHMMNIDEKEYLSQTVFSNVRCLFRKAARW